MKLNADIAMTPPNTSSSTSVTATNATKGRLRFVARSILLLACSVLVAVQLLECFRKLASPPVSTHTSIALNANLTYPAVTICRRPAYRNQVLEKYNLTDVTTTSQWSSFPYQEITLEDFWNEAVFNQSEVLVAYALNQLVDNVRVEARTYLRLGRCFTLRPRSEGAMQSPSRDAQPGYSIMLGHRRLAPPGDPTIGWTLHVHQDGETFIEEGGHSMGRQEHLFVEVGEELHISVTVEEIRLVDRRQQRCNTSIDHQNVECLARCHWERLAHDAGCSAPWLPVAGFPHCHSDEGYQRLLVGYLNDDCTKPCCGCLRSCRVHQLRPLVIKRRLVESTAANHPLSQVYVSYASKVVKRVEEHMAYDWSVFLAEAGGSLGFLLGLSVVGAAEALERCARAALPLVHRAAAAVRRAFSCRPPAPRGPSYPTALALKTKNSVLEAVFIPGSVTQAV